MFDRELNSSAELTAQRYAWLLSHAMCVCDGGQWFTETPHQADVVLCKLMLFNLTGALSSILCSKVG